MCDKSGIIVFCGPMKSGKSNHLLLYLDKLTYAKIPYLLIKPNIDSRTPNKVFTRYLNKSESAVEVDINNPKTILDLIDLNKLKLPYVVAIDEAQFFGSGIVDVVKTLNSKGVGCVLAGLDTDAKMRTFGSMGDLLAMATCVRKLTSVCEFCQGVGTQTSLIENDPDFEKNNVKITKTDGSTEHTGEIFTSLCLKCYYSHNAKLNESKQK